LIQATPQKRMKIGIVLDISEGSLDGRTPTFRDLREMALVAEQVGLDSLWLADHLIYRFPNQAESAPWETLTMLSALAAVTTRITLGTLVVCTSFRPPAMLAKMADALDEVSGERFILGLGAGWHQPEYEAFGYPFDHLTSRFDEALQIIVPLLREGHVDFQGQYYQVRNCVLRPRGPSPAGPRILIGAHRPRMLQLVARYADAWNTAWHTGTAIVKERYEPLAQACAGIGRDPATLEITVGTEVRLQPRKDDGSPDNAISGAPEEIAVRLQDFASVGNSHLMVALDAVTPASIEQLGRIAELARRR
jgi:alkanesulfonate monooxygenase SsuD/methylene tetrahydromethanopterin reductase-like flavin-dependent oxidoreductase (luciferase family)